MKNTGSKSATKLINNMRQQRAELQRNDRRVRKTLATGGDPRARKSPFSRFGK